MIFKDKEVLKKLNVLLKYSIQRDRDAMNFIEDLVAKFEKMTQLDLFSLKESMTTIAYDIERIKALLTPVPSILSIALPSKKKKTYKKVDKRKR